MERDSIIRMTTLTHPWLEEVIHDVNNVASGIRKVEDGYFIVRNHMSGKYEVHHIENYPTTYSFLVPYDSLDYRTIEYCLRTRRENVEKLLKEMDDNNEKLKKESERIKRDRITDIALDTAKDLRRAI